MDAIPVKKFTPPKAASWEIIRKDLIDTVFRSQGKSIYIHAGAGFGKTTLLSQIAASCEYTVWISLDGENDILTFLNSVSKAIGYSFNDFTFNIPEYQPFEERGNFVPLLANALLSDIEKLDGKFMIILDDLHTVEDQRIDELLSYIIKYKPENITLCISSRKSPSPEFSSLIFKGELLELTQRELAFSKEETCRTLGNYGRKIYDLTEGWPLIVGSFRILPNNGAAFADIFNETKEALRGYFYHECISLLPPETADLLYSTACFPELDVQMLDFVLGIKNSGNILESLLSLNIFTVMIYAGHYRYHTMFREYLLEVSDPSENLSNLRKAAQYYYNNQLYSKAAEYAIESRDMQILKKNILAAYKPYIDNIRFSELNTWFDALDQELLINSKELLAAKVAYLSYTGNFSEAKVCLDAVIPLLSCNDKLYPDTMLHKARVLRNHTSFQESNKILDELLESPRDLEPEMLYRIVIEKIFNLCWSSQIREAFKEINDVIDFCAQSGYTKVKAWFERYLTVVHFFAGRMKDSVHFYERSLELSEDERRRLDIHNVDIYAAKAYQMLGNRKKASYLIYETLDRLRGAELSEELWAGYLLAAEINYHDAFIEKMNGEGEDFSTTLKYFSLAEEYAPLCRKTRFQENWAKLYRLVCSLSFSDKPEDARINEILLNLDGAGDYLKTIVLGRLFNYYESIGNIPGAVILAKQSIEIGERADIMMIPTLALGILARAAIAIGDSGQAVLLIRRFLKLCSENGIYDYFRIRNTYDHILELAFSNGIEPDFTQKMSGYSGYRTKKAYIKTLGELSVCSNANRQQSLKMRTKKERELLAYLLDAGDEGVTKEQIFNALWSESKSVDIKKLIGVNLAHLKKDLLKLGIRDPVINREKRYSICRDEIELDCEAFEKAAEEFGRKRSDESAQTILSLYKGEYLSDFEAHWAINKRIRYEKIYGSALNFVVIEESSCNNTWST